MYLKVATKRFSRQQNKAAKKIYSGENKIGGDKKVKRQKKNKAATKRVRWQQKTITPKPRRAIHSHSIFFVATLFFFSPLFFFPALYFLRRLSGNKKIKRQQKIKMARKITKRRQKTKAVTTK